MATMLQGNWMNSNNVPLVHHQQYYQQSSASVLQLASEKLKDEIITTVLSELKVKESKKNDMIMMMNCKILNTVYNNKDVLEDILNRKKEKEEKEDNIKVNDEILNRIKKLEVIQQQSVCTAVEQLNNKIGNKLDGIFDELSKLKFNFDCHRKELINLKENNKNKKDNNIRLLLDKIGNIESKLSEFDHKFDNNITTDDLKNEFLIIKNQLNESSNIINNKIDQFVDKLDELNINFEEDAMSTAVALQSLRYKIDDLKGIMVNNKKTKLNDNNIKLNNISSMKNENNDNITLKKGKLNKKKFKNLIISIDRENRIINGYKTRSVIGKIKEIVTGDNEKIILNINDKINQKIHCIEIPKGIEYINEFLDYLSDKFNRKPYIYDLINRNNLGIIELNRNNNVKLIDINSFY